MNDSLNEVLKNGIYEYLRNNPKRDTVDIVEYFGIRTDELLTALADLKEEKKVKVVWSGLKHSYVVSECP